jgi:hypothetical protein
MLYYYVKETDIRKLYGPYGWYGEIERKVIPCEFEDYPTHRHRSRGGVYAMELIPEKKYLETKYLHYSRVYFDKIELSKDEVITDGWGRKFIKSFEKKYDTPVWQEWSRRHKKAQ